MLATTQMALSTTKVTFPPPLVDGIGVPGAEPFQVDRQPADEVVHVSPPLARITFAAVRAIGILAVDTLSSVKTRRAMLTISVSVGAIHIYAQHFERLDAPPEVIMIPGVISIRTARVYWAFVRRLAWRRLEPGTKAQFTPARVWPAMRRRVRLGSKSDDRRLSASRPFSGSEQSDDVWSKDRAIKGVRVD